MASCARNGKYKTSDAEAVEGQQERGGVSQANELLLATALEVAVPLCIHNLQCRGGVTEDILEQARKTSWELAGHGDNLLYRGKKRGETARLFQQVAEAIAVLAFCPGGITIFGLHFEASVTSGGV